jgi:hypothetical protein
VQAPISKTLGLPSLPTVPAPGPTSTSLVKTVSGTVHHVLKRVTGAAGTGSGALSSTLKKVGSTLKPTTGSSGTGSAPTVTGTVTGTVKKVVPTLNPVIP